MWRTPMRGLRLARALQRGCITRDWLVRIEMGGLCTGPPPQNFSVMLSHIQFRIGRQDFKLTKGQDWVDTCGGLI